MRRVIFVIVIVLLLIPTLHPAHASEEIQTPSGRLSLSIPDTWVVREMPEEEELQGLDSETLVLATSYDVIDQYLSGKFFDGTVIFLSAYPYSVYTPDVLGSIRDMLADVTVYDLSEISEKTIAGFAGAEFYYSEAGRFFVSEVIFDTGELTYRTTTYSTRFDDQSTLEDILNSAQVNTISLDQLLLPNQPTRQVRTRDGRLSMVIPRNWLYWDEGDISLSFAPTGQAYADLAYAFNPAQNSEVAFIIYRLVKSALRPAEVVNGTVDLPALMRRLRDENGGLQKDAPLQVTQLDGIPMLEASWLVKGQAGSVLTRTRLLDGGDAVYLVQAQSSTQPKLQPIVDAIFASMRYTPPQELVDPTQVGLEVGQLAPDFTLPLLDGTSASLSDYRGEIVMINMWATWCGPCHREAPHLQQYYEEYGGRFEILAVNVGETVPEARGFVQDYGLTFPVLMDTDMQVATLYGLDAYPTTFILGRDGVILQKVRGSFSEQGLRDVLALYVGR